MKIAILADIHANYQALSQTSKYCEKLGINKVWFLGDIVGRGPEPQKCIKWLMSNVDRTDKTSWIIGNHEVLLLKLLPKEIYIQLSVNSKYMIPKHLEEIQTDQEIWVFVHKNFTISRTEAVIKIIDGVNHILTHGGLKDFPNYPYLYPWEDSRRFKFQIAEAIRIFNTVKPSIIWFGHTHVPTLISIGLINSSLNVQTTKVVPGETYTLDPNKWWIINPGSIGYSRNLDPKAFFIVLDTLSLNIIFVRVDYDLSKTMHLMEINNYPKKLLEIISSADMDEMPYEWVEHFNKVKF